MVIIFHPDMLSRGDSILSNMILNKDFQSLEDVRRRFNQEKYSVHSKEWKVFYGSMQGHYAYSTISSQTIADRVIIKFWF